MEIITHKTKNGSLVKMRNVKTIKRDMPVHNVFVNFYLSIYLLT